MQTSDAGLQFLIRREGMRLKLYNDIAGNATIGVGHLVHKGRCDSSSPNRAINAKYEAAELPYVKAIDEKNAMSILKSDVQKFEKGVNENVDVDLKQNQFDALIAFTFNVGLHAFENSTMLDKINDGKMAEAASEFLRWCKAGGKISHGLLKRRKLEMHLFADGIYG